MAPDLNSLSPPPASTTAPDIRTSHITANMSSLALDPQRTSQGFDGPPSPSPRSTSLQAAATLNAGLQREEPSRRSSRSSSFSRSVHSPSSGRRRSQVLMNLNLADPTIPAPGEMISEPGHSFRSPSPHISASPQPLYSGEPQHFRAPSLGELHQELENEQEFQVNRLLGEIRRLQLQVQRQQSGQLSGSAVGDDSTPPSAHPTSGSLPRSPGFPQHPRSSFDHARADLSRRSRTPSRGASPRMRATSIGDSSDQIVPGGRDEIPFYQAETQNLIRENQMLRHRIRELEKQLTELSGGGNSLTAHEPSHSSHLSHSTSVSEDDRAKQQPAIVTEAAKDE